MISGSRPDTPDDTMRASGVMPSSAAFVSLITTTAAAPSFSGQALPAVTVPSGRNTGLSLASPSAVVPSRGQSSVSATEPSGSVYGVISSVKNPECCAATARCWLNAANSSCSARDTSSISATFSAVWPIPMYTSGRNGCGSHGPPPPSARAAVRSSASATRGLCVSGMPSALPCTNRDTHSTPAATNTSPSPA